MSALGRRGAIQVYNNHRSQATAFVFVKHNLEDTLPTMVSALLTQLDQVPYSHVADHAMWFGASLRRKHSFWNKKRGELYDMITQLGSPTFFFTLSVADTKWTDLHMLMPCPRPTFFLHKSNGEFITI